jgi:ATP-binding cassette subfamily B protein
VVRELKILAGLARPHWRRYVVGLGAMAMTDVGNLAIPWIVGRFIDEARAHHLTPDLAWRYGGAIVGVSLLVAVFRYLWRMNIFGTARMIEFELRDRLFKHLITLSADFFQRRTIGDMMAHATNDLQAVRALVGEGVMSGYDAAILVVMAIGVSAITIDWRLTLASLLPLPLLAVFEWRLGRTIHLRYKDVQAAFGTLSERVQETVSGIRVIKAFVQEPATQNRFEQDNEAYYERVMRMTRLNSLNDPVITLLSGLSAVIALGYGGRLVLDGHLSVGQFTAFLAYLATLAWPMLAIGWAANLAQRGTASMARIQAVLDEVPTVRDGTSARELQTPMGRIEIRDLSYRYGPDLPLVLDRLSLTVEPGRTLGIIGRTGSGKSTLANLLVRLYDPPRGTMFLDGQDLNDLTLASVRGAIAYVPQDAFLFSDTLEANLSFDPAPHTAEEVRAIARVVNLDDEIARMPRGYETMLGERGITLSGGQRQRVGIGRALMKQAPILVLDDCLSAVDTVTEARILAELRPLMAERTTIVVSHRVSTVQHADEILLLDAGRVVERGTHAELLDLGGSYRALHDRQRLEAAIALGG